MYTSQVSSTKESAKMAIFQRIIIQAHFQPMWQIKKKGTWLPAQKHIGLQIVSKVGITTIRETSF